MRIRGWYIDGFGVFCDEQCERIDDRLTIILGPNEAGKSTLLAFIRYVLFGPPRARNANAYAPLRGGKHGGRLFLAADEGTFTVERYGRSKTPTVIRPDGQPGDEEELQALLGGADAQVFNSVFAFSLFELQTLDSLTNESVQERIFSAGIQGASANAIKLSSIFEKEMENLFRPRAASVINRLIKQLEENGKARRQAERIARHYKDFVDREQDGQALVDSLTHRLEDARKRMGRVTCLLDAWAPFCEKRAVEEKLRELPEIDSFPEDGVARLERINERIRNLQADIDKLKQRCNAAREDIQRIAIDDALASRAPSVKRLSSRIAVVNDRRVNLPKQKQTCETAQADLKSSLAKLGPGWTEDRLEQTHLTVEQEGEVRRFRRAIQEARQTVTQQRSLLEAQAAQSEVGTSNLPRWTVPVGSFAVLIAVALSVAAFVRGDFLVGALGSAVALALAVMVHRIWLVFSGSAVALQAKERRVQPFREALTAAQEQLDREERTWREWLARTGLPETWDAETVEDFLQTLKDARAQLRAFRKAHEEVAQAEGEIDRWLTDVQQLCIEIHRKAPQDIDTAVALLHRLDDEIEADRKARERREQLRREIEHAERELAVKNHELERARAEKQSLLAAASALDEEKFRQLARVCEERRELKKKLDALNAEINRHAAKRPKEEAILQALDEGAYDSWLEEKQALEAEIREIENKREQAIGDLRDRQNERKAAEEASDLARLALEETQLREQLREAIQEWTTYAMAKRLVEETLDEFTRARQPAVLQHASQLFKTITSGRYVQILQTSNMGNHGFVVLTPAGDRVTVDKLSRGTAEQLYLAVRLGLVREFAQRTVALPIVMDDVLVNFDPARAERTAVALAEMSEHHQILLFTCHPETAELVRKVKECEVIELAPR